MTEKNEDGRGIKLLLCTNVGIHIFRVSYEQDKHVYFCWKRVIKNKSNSIHCVMVRGKSDERVVEFCEENGLEMAWLSAGDGLFIIVCLSVNNEKSILKIVDLFRKGGEW